MIEELDRETVYEYYVEKEWSQKMIAEKFDCSRGTVRNRLERFGIEKRSHSECLETAYEKDRKEPINQEGEQNPFYGKNHSEESKRKMSKSAKERYKENEHPMKEKGLMGVWKEKYSKKKFEKKKDEFYETVSKTMTGVSKTEEHRRNIRKAFVQEMKNKLGEFDGFVPNYNPDACRLIEEYGEKHGYNFQHAENGGEVFVAGYWVDGYDEEANVAIEVDEPHHYNRNGDLREQDRQKERKVKNELDCKFIRLRIDD